MAKLIGPGESLNQGRLKLNEAIADAEKAKLEAGKATGIAGQSERKADQAVAHANSIQEQFNQLIIEGDSSVEAAQARVDETGASHSTLKARLDTGFTEVNQQLAETAKKSEVSNQLNDIGISQINKNKGLIDQTYLSPGLIEQIAGTAPVNAVPAVKSIKTLQIAEKAISPTRTSFMSISENLYNSNAVLIDQNLNTTNGTTFYNAGFFVSDFIEVTSGVTYTKSTDEPICFYDVNKVFVSSETGKTTFTVPENINFIRFTLIGNARRLNNMLVIGSALPSNFVPYEVYLKKTDENALVIEANKLSENTIIPKRLFPADSVNFLNKSINLFDRRKALTGVYVNSTNGNEASSANYFTSDFIEVKPNTTYTTNISAYYAFYDDRKKYISGNTSGLSFTTTPATKYVRKSGLYPSPQFTTGMLVEGSVLPITYVPFGYQFTDEINTEVKQWKGKKWLSIGDSYSAANVYQRFANEICGFSETRIDAVVGRSTKNFMDNVTAESLADIDVVTVLGGANDFDNLIIGTIDDTKDSNTWYGMNKKNIEHVLSLKPSIRLIFVTVSQFYTNAFPSGINANGVTAYKMALATKDVCASYGIPVIDVFSESGINKLTETLYLSPDRLHPNSIGYEVLGRLIGKGLNRLY